MGVSSSRSFREIAQVFGCCGAGLMVQRGECRRWINVRLNVSREAGDLGIDLLLNALSVSRSFLTCGSKFASPEVQVLRHIAV